MQCTATRWCVRAKFARCGRMPLDSQDIVLTSVFFCDGRSGLPASRSDEQGHNPRRRGPSDAVSDAESAVVAFLEAAETPTTLADLMDHLSTTALPEAALAVATLRLLESERVRFDANHRMALKTNPAPA